MQDFEFEIWDIKNKNFDKVMPALFYPILGLMIVTVILSENPIWLFIFLILQILLIVVHHHGVKYHKVGEIIFREADVSISNDMQLKYDEILKIKLNFGDLKGNLMGANPGGALVGLLMLSKGVRNKIVIRTANERLSFHILCKEDSDYLRFRLLGKFLKEKNLNVKMNDIRV